MDARDMERYDAGEGVDMRFTSTPRKAAGAQQATDHGLAILLATRDKMTQNVNVHVNVTGDNLQSTQPNKRSSKPK